MSKKYTVKHTETNQRGHKVITKIITEDEELVKSMLSKPQRDYMDAEYNDRNTEAKSAHQERKRPASGLSTPKKNASKDKSSNLKTYQYIIEELDSLPLNIYAPNKVAADKIIRYYCKKMNYHASFSKVSKRTWHKNFIEKRQLTTENYYQRQIESIDKM